MSTILQLGELDAEIQRGDDVVFPFEFWNEDPVTKAVTPLIITWSVVYMIIKASAEATTPLKELKTATHDDVNKTHLTLSSTDSTNLTANTNLYFLVAIKDSLGKIQTQFDWTIKTSLSITPAPTA